MSESVRRPWLCRLGYHDWRIELHGHLVDGRGFRQVGDEVQCRRRCGAICVATKSGWEIRDGGDPTP